MPPKGEPREWHPLEVNSKRADAIQTDLGALEPPAFGKKDASGAESKRVLAHLTAELTECGALPVKRKAAKAAAGEQHAGEQIDFFEALDSKASETLVRKLEADNMARQLTCMGNQEMLEKDLNRGHRTQTLEEGA
jgi:hypothetical protein